MNNALIPTAKDINEAHRLAKSCAETAVQHAIECGRLLEEKKAEVGHGNFMPWVQKHCDFSYASAAVYLRAAKQSSRGLEFSSLNQLLAPPKPVAQKTVTPSEPVVMNPPESAAMGSEARNHDQARVMGMGDVHRAAEGRPPEAAPTPDFDFAGYEPEDDDAYKANIENVMMADDKLAAMREELKQCHREMQGLRASRDHYQRQSGEAVRLAKSKDREIEKLKKELANWKRQRADA